MGQNPKPQRLMSSRKEVDKTAGEINESRGAAREGMSRKDKIARLFKEKLEEQHSVSNPLVT